MIVLQTLRFEAAYRRGLALICCVFCLLGSLQAQTVPAKKKTDARADTIPFRGRWQFRTNAVDWMLTMPNVAVEFDLGKSVYNKLTVGVGAKYNWNTTHKYVPSLLFNLFDVRGEVRQYYRTEQRNDRRPDTLKVSIFRRLKEDVFSRRRFNPRYWRGYYWGAYANYASYAFKFGGTGIQGTCIGAGVSWGFTVPLYGYKTNFVDMELGGSLGLLYTEYDRFTFDAESNCYPITSHKDGHLVPFPVITDLRLAFVYRFVSVKDKFKRGDTPGQAARKERREKRANERKALNDSINAAREAAEAKRQKEEKARLRQTADSLGISVDSLMRLMPRELTKEERKAQREQEKAAREAEREAAKKAKAEEKAAKKAAEVSSAAEPVTPEQQPAVKPEEEDDVVARKEDVE